MFVWGARSKAEDCQPPHTVKQRLITAMEEVLLDFPKPLLKFIQHRAGYDLDIKSYVAKCISLFVCCMANMAQKPLPAAHSYSLKIRDYLQNESRKITEECL